MGEPRGVFIALRRPGGLGDKGQAVSHDLKAFRNTVPAQCCCVCAVCLSFPVPSPQAHLERSLCLLLKRGHCVWEGS